MTLFKNLGLGAKFSVSHRRILDEGFGNTWYRKRINYFNNKVVNIYINILCTAKGFYFCIFTHTIISHKYLKYLKFLTLYKTYHETKIKTFFSTCRGVKIDKNKIQNHIFFLHQY